MVNPQFPMKEVDARGDSVRARQTAVCRLQPNPLHPRPLSSLTSAAPLVSADHISQYSAVLETFLSTQGVCVCGGGAALTYPLTLEHDGGPGHRRSTGTTLS